MTPLLEFPGFPVETTFKRMRSLRLRVHADGRVTVSAPTRTPLAEIRRFVESRMDWILRHRERLRAAPERVAAVAPMESGARHAVWGAMLPLLVLEFAGPPRVEATAERLVMQVRPGTDETKRRAALAAFYAGEVRRALPELIARWEARLGVASRGHSVRAMRSRWGSCCLRDRTVRFNADLARRAPEFLEYVVVHELAHLIEPGHGPRFRAVMDHHLPGWREIRKRLNEGGPEAW